MGKNDEDADRADPAQPHRLAPCRQHPQDSAESSESYLRSWPGNQISYKNICLQTSNRITTRVTNKVFFYSYLHSSSGQRDVSARS